MIMPKIISIGDVNPVEHGGGVVISNADGLRLEYFEPNDDETVTRYTVFSVDDPSQLDWIDTNEIEAFNGELATGAQLFVDVASYYGWANLNPNIQTLTTDDANDLLNQWEADSNAVTD